MRWVEITRYRGIDVKWGHQWVSQVALVVKNLPANAGDARVAGLISGLGRSPGGWHGNLLQCSCLGNPMKREAWLATVHKVTKSQMRLKGLSTQALKHSHRGSLVTRDTSRGTCSPLPPLDKNNHQLGPGATTEDGQSCAQGIGEAGTPLPGDVLRTAEQSS